MDKILKIKNVQIKIGVKSMCFLISYQHKNWVNFLTKNFKKYTQINARKIKKIKHIFVVKKCKKINKK